MRTRARVRMRVTRSLVALALCAALSAGTLSADGELRVTFDDMSAERAPAGFSFGRTGQGEPGSWVVRDRALAQTSTDTTDYRFPVALYDGGTWKDVAVSVRFRTVSGEVDQAAGLVVRATDESNYLIVRANALEDNTRLYRVVDGRRKQIAGRDMTVTPGEWHTLKLEAKGEALTVWFDGEKIIDARDATFLDAGKVGLWTKADSVTLFDDLVIEPR